MFPHTILFFNVFYFKIRTLKQKQLLCYVSHCLKTLFLVEIRALRCLVNALMAEEMFKIPVKQKVQIACEVVTDKRKSCRDTVDMRFKDLNAVLLL